MPDDADNQGTAKKPDPIVAPKKKVKLSALPTGAQLHRSLGILLKYDPNLHIDATYDQIMFSTNLEDSESAKLAPKNLNPEDKKRLKLMGLLWDKDNEHWVMLF